MLNNNLKDAMDNLKLLFKVPSDRAYIDAYATPFFEIDPDTCKIVLHVDKELPSSINTATTPNTAYFG